MAQDPMQLFGDKALSRALIEIGDDSALRVMRPAISKALVPVKQQAKQNVEPNTRSGALRRAIAKKAGGRRGRSKAWGKVYVKSMRLNWSVDGRKDRAINPAKYAHLVEFGTTHSRANPFLRRAMSTRKAQVNSILNREGWNNMIKFAGRLRKKHNTMKAFRKSRSRARRVS